MFTVGELLIDGGVSLFFIFRVLVLFYHFYDICLYIFAKIMLGRLNFSIFDEQFILKNI
jgi:hypothetical protein